MFALITLECDAAVEYFRNWERWSVIHRLFGLDYAPEGHGFCLKSDGQAELDDKAENGTARKRQEI